MTILSKLYCSCCPCEIQECHNSFQAVVAKFSSLTMFKTNLLQCWQIFIFQALPFASVVQRRSEQMVCMSNNLIVMDGQPNHGFRHISFLPEWPQLAFRWAVSVSLNASWPVFNVLFCLKTNKQKLCLYAKQIVLISVLFLYYWLIFLYFILYLIVFKPKQVHYLNCKWHSTDKMWEKYGCGSWPC